MVTDASNVPSLEEAMKTEKRNRVLLRIILKLETWIKSLPPADVEQGLTEFIAEQKSNFVLRPLDRSDAKAIWDFIRDRGIPSSQTRYGY
jgi:hypothetical protein